MRPMLRLAVLAALPFLVAGCNSNLKPVASFTASAAPAQASPSGSPATSPLVTAYVDQGDLLMVRSLASLPRAEGFPRSERRPSERPEPFFGSSFRGRTLEVSSIHDIALRDREVILTFDDGPVPGRTGRILDALDRYGVKATFLVVGQMAKANPGMVRDIARRGHTIGSHTYSHPNLARMSPDRAIAEIRRGERAIEDAGQIPAFFRFPYLADTQALRRTLANRGVVVLDVDIDSKDYFKVSPNAVIERTMRTLRAKGKGIVLMHDLQERTAVMLPELLRQMKAEGYRVVTLVPSQETLTALAR